MTRALAFLCVAALSAAPVRAEGPAFDVVSYDVRLTPDFATQEVSGQTVIRFKSTADGLTSLSFSANTLDIVASLNGEQIVEGEVQGDRRLFHLPRPMRKGETGRLTVTFKGKAPKGLVWAKDHVYANYFTCDFQVCDQDRPGDKAGVTFDVVVPQGMDVVSPGATRRPVSAYLLGFAAGRFLGVGISTERHAARILAAVSEVETVTHMFADTPHMMAFFERKAGVRLPAKIYTQVLVEGGEAQEAASHAIIGFDNIAPILENPREDWVIAHELAHQWWGNAVTCADWSELWLNEGLTVFMVAAWKEQRWGRADYDRELDLANKRWNAAKAEGFDVPLSWQGKYPSLKLKRAMAYAKAVVFLDTLRRDLGEDAFWRGIKTYTRTNWDKAVRAQDLQRALERSSKRDLSALFAAWVYGPKP
jgi:aminopeptidase N